MYEIKNGDNYSVYNTSVNSDTFTWKLYDHDFSNISKNRHNLYEIKLNLHDAALNGT